MDAVQANYDEPRRRFQPDRTLVALAYNAMLAGETHQEAYVRQHWEAAYAATKVALDVLREIYPIDRDTIGEDHITYFAHALDHLTRAYEALDEVSVEMLGEAMCDVLAGRITTTEGLLATIQWERDDECAT